VQGRAAALSGGLEVAQCTVSLSQVGVMDGIAGVEDDGPPDALGSLTRISLLMGDDAKQVQGVGVVGLGAQDVAVQPDCLAQAPALVFLQAEGKVVVHGDVPRNADGGSGVVGQELVHPNRRACGLGEGPPMEYSPVNWEWIASPNG
jgi:hypothetical protein